ncbi:LuxR C-terminal-related transcriptional regulator [Cohnella cellulosilytica]|uniref:LuxR C-terminal-related transcriptional regulator n=1 Tax=Cohnella cellulosilytica TaxID=986710 RepID=A0ABW2FHB7_9BACL
MSITSSRSIKSLLEESSLSLDRVITYGIQMAETIHDAHLRSGIIADLQLDDFYVQSGDGVTWSAATAWNPAYGSPELLGLGRRPDERSDLYAFGAMLYEMLTGRLPIEPEGEQTWEEAHLIRSPRPFPQPVAEAAGPLCRIIGKALEKSPQARYQTAYGMLMDLRLMRKNPNHAEELCRYDRRSRLTKPERALGRQEDFAGLNRVFRASRTERQVLEITGAKGIGKTRLMKEWKRQLLREDVLVALVSALDVGSGGELLEQAEEQWLRQALCRQDVQAGRTYRTERELQHVLILDDGERADLSVIDEAFGWLERLEPSRGGLLVLLHSDAAIDLRDRAASLQVKELPISRLRLEPLGYEHVLEWLTAALHERSPRVRVLAGALQQWSGGVPREIEENLTRWHAEGSLSYHYERHHWEWTEDLISKAPVSEGYKQAMDNLMERLPDESVHALTIAALIGPRFSVRALIELSNLDEDRLRTWIEIAQASGFISPEEDAGDDYLFLSAYVQSKLYRSIPQNERSVWHCRIGEVYDRHGGEEAGETARRHLNLGADQLSGHRRRLLAERNYTAGMLAMNQARFAQATDDFEQALGLAEREGEQPDELACKIGYQLYNLLHYRGSTERAVEGFVWIREHADKLSDEDRLAACLCQQDLFAVNDPGIALRLSRDTMAVFGWRLPERVSPLTALTEAFRATLLARRIEAKDERIADNLDFEYVAQSRILLGLMYTLSISDPVLLLYAFSRFVRHGLTRGRNEYFLNLLDSFELLLQRGLPGIYRHWPKRLRDAWSSGLRVRPAQQTRRLYTKGMIEQFERPEESASIMERVLRQTREQHQVTFFNLAAITSLISTWGTARQLRELVGYLEQEAEPLLDATSLRMIRLVKSYLRACEEDGAWERYTRSNPPEGEEEQPDNYDFVLRAEQAYLHGRYAETLLFAQRAKTMEMKIDWVRNRRVLLFEALAQAALYEEGTKAERRIWSRAIRRRIKRMDAWQGPFGRSSSAYWLIRAEWAKANRQNRAALHAYERAAACAKHEFPSVFRPLCMERLALYYREKGMEAGALIALLEAMSAYSAYGYAAKRNRLEQEHPDVEGSIRAFASLPEAEAAEERRTPKRSERLTESGDRPFEPATALKTMRPEELLAVACRKAGADRGLIAATSEGTALRVLAYYGVGDRKESALAQGVLKAAVAKKGPVVLPNAEQSEFLADPHIAAGRSKSILCLPIDLPGIASPAVLYLENTQIADVFSERIAADIEALVKNFAYLSLFEEPSDAVWGVWSIEKEAVARSAAGKSGTSGNPESSLSDRETEVLRAIAAGYSNKEIAALLAITEATVKTHTHHLYGKLGVKRRGQAIAKAREFNLGGL